MTHPNGLREVGPERHRRFREHPRAEPELPKMQQAFETDAVMGRVVSDHLKRAGDGYAVPGTQRAYLAYQRGWSAHKHHMDFCIEQVLKSTKDPEEREAFLRAFTRMRMAL